MPGSNDNRIQCISEGSWVNLDRLLPQDTKARASKMLLLDTATYYVSASVHRYTAPQKCPVRGVMDQKRKII